MTEKRLFVGRKTCEDRFTIITDYENEIGVRETNVLKYQKQSKKI